MIELERVKRNGEERGFARSIIIPLCVYHSYVAALWWALSNSDGSYCSEGSYWVILIIPITMAWAAAVSELDN